MSTSTLTVPSAHSMSNGHSASAQPQSPGGAPPSSSSSSSTSSSAAASMSDAMLGAAVPSSLLVSSPLSGYAPFRPPPIAHPASFRYDPLNLSNIRATLIRLEESIIFALIERAQFRLNPPIYSPAAMPQFDGLSFLSFFLHETERLHAKVRRYTSPDEHPFAEPSSLPQPILPQLPYPVTLKENAININSTIYAWYIDTVLPCITQPGDDQNYGSAATADINCLQLLSKRIHYGKFVAESKFRSEPETFTRAIQQHDLPALMDLITKPVVEEQVIQRVHLKAATYGGEPSGLTPGNSPMPIQSSMQHSSSFNALNSGDSAGGGGGGGALSSGVGVDVMAGSGFIAGKYKISPDVIASIYLGIIRLNKEVQLEYLLERLQH